MKKIIVIISLLIFPLLSCFDGYNNQKNGSLKMMLYVINGTTVSGYSINPKTGKLKFVNTVNTGANPNSIKSDPSGRFVYVTNSGSNSISGYAIDPEDGLLTSLQGSPFTAGNGTSQPNSLSIHTNGKYLYVTNYQSGAGSIEVFDINSSTGGLTTVCTYAAAPDTNVNCIDTYGHFFYNVEPGGIGVRQYPVNSETGLLGSGVFYGGGGLAFITFVTIEPLSRFIYIVDINGVFVSIINSSTGAFSTPVLQTASQNIYGNRIVFNPNGEYAYVQNVVVDSISVYKINSSTGALTQIPGSPYSAGTGLHSAVVDPSGKFVYASNATDNTVSLYKRKSSTGALTFVQNMNIANTPSFMNIVVLPCPD